MAKTQGEIEAAICEAMTRFEQEHMGRGPKRIHAYLIDESWKAYLAQQSERTR